MTREPACGESPAHRPTFNRSYLAATVVRFSDSPKDPRRSTVLSGG